MLKEVEKNAAKPANFLDKAISFFSPVVAARRARARLALSVFNSYDGADKGRRALKEWKTFGNDADADILDDLSTLRENSRDLVRNNPIATGAIKTKVTSVVGTGLRLQSRIDRDALRLTDGQADAWEAKTEREWRLFWDSKNCDVTRTLNGFGLTRQVYQQAKENGDVFILLPRVTRPGVPYELALQVIEADRVCNPDGVADSETLAGGIKKDKHGAPLKYYILKHHPGNKYIQATEEWETRPAFGQKTGIRNVIHLYNPTRPGQTRGVPDLAPVIEALKQLGRYTEAEIMAAVISGMFTVFIETETGEGVFDYTNLANETGQKSSDRDLKMGNGVIMELARGEKVHDSNPGRPNTAFDQFVLAILRQVGVALEIPFEILTKHFVSSYSASRAALLELWKYVLTERQWLADNFLKLVYEVWMYEAVAAGRVVAPGFLADPGIRAAYLEGDFIGPAKGQLDELKEVKAAQARVDGGFSTISLETTELTGGDWEKNHKQRVKENTRRLDDGLIVPETEETEDQQTNEK